MIARTYSLLANLPLVVDGYALEGLSRRVSTGFRRFTTVFRLSGAGHEGLGEDVTYEASEHRHLIRSGSVLPLSGDWTLDSFSRALDELDQHLLVVRVGQGVMGDGMTSGAVRRIAAPGSGALL